MDIALGFEPEVYAASGLPFDDVYKTVSGRHACETQMTKQLQGLTG